MLHCGEVKDTIKAINFRRLNCSAIHEMDQLVLLPVFRFAYLGWMPHRLRPQ